MQVTLLTPYHTDAQPTSAPASRAPGHHLPHVLQKNMLMFSVVSQLAQGVRASVENSTRKRSSTSAGGRLLPSFSTVVLLWEGRGTERGGRGRTERGGTGGRSGAGRGRRASEPSRQTVSTNGSHELPLGRGAPSADRLESVYRERIAVLQRETGPQTESDWSQAAQPGDKTIAAAENSKQ